MPDHVPAGDQTQRLTRSAPKTRSRESAACSAYTGTREFHLSFPSTSRFQIEGFTLAMLGASWVADRAVANTGTPQASLRHQTSPGMSLRGIAAIGGVAAIRIALGRRKRRVRSHFETSRILAIRASASVRTRNSTRRDRAGSSTPLWSNTGWDEDSPLAVKDRLSQSRSPST